MMVYIAGVLRATENHQLYIRTLHLEDMGAM